MARAIVVAVAAIALVAGASQVAGVFRRTSEAVTGEAGLTHAQRLLIPARAYDMATELWLAAREEIPVADTYTVITGSGIMVSSPLTLFKAPVFARFYLLPRRYVSDPRQADWILSYGGDLQSLHLRFRRTQTILPGLEIARVAR